MLDLCTRVNMRKVTKRVLESLIKSGSLDSLGCHRAELMDAMDRVTALAQRKARDRDSGQASLFAAIGQEEPCLPGIGVEMDGPAVEPWSDDEKLRQEKEVLGFYLTDHPLMPFRHEMRRIGLIPLSECAEHAPGREVRVGVIVTGFKEHLTRKGERMAFVQIEDLAGSGEATMFPEFYAQAKPWMVEDRPLLITAEISRYKNGAQDEGEEGNRKARLTVTAVEPLAEAFEKSDLPVRLEIDAARLSGDGMERFKETLARYPGKAPVHLSLRLNGALVRLQCGPRFQVWPNPEFWREMDEWTVPAPGETELSMAEVEEAPA
jgi:DNA polymerase-3 subunit alpha